MRAQAPLAARVFARLAAGGFQSGSDLAVQLGVSRNAVWKAVGALRDIGVGVHAVPNRGYRLAVPVAPIAAQSLRGRLSTGVRNRIRRLEAEWSLASTNAELLARTDLPPGQCDVLLAEHQTAGRGRRGRSWLAPPGGAICLSLGWCFAQTPRDLPALGLAIGVCALQAVTRELPPDAVLRPDLKWPNDLVVGTRKLAGILIELRAEGAGPAYVVIGIGVNAVLGTGLRDQVLSTGTEPVDLNELGIEPLRRAAVVAGLVDSCVQGLSRFEAEGLKPFMEEWRRADALRGRAVCVQLPNETVRGTARGIDVDGTLLVETAQGLRRFASGEVSVRPQDMGTA